MRKLILTLFAILSTFLGIRAQNPQPLPSKNGDKYQVIHIKGVIKDKQNQKVLKRESTFDALEELEFSKNADLLVLDEQKQVFRIQFNTADSTYTLKPLAAKIGLRPGKILNYLAFQKFLESRKLLVLGDSLTLEIGQAEFPLDEQCFFYIEYQWKGEAIPKKIAHQSNRILIEKEALFKVDSKAIAQEEASQFAFHYYNQESKETLFINNFQLIFPDEAQLLQELRLLSRHYKEIDKTNTEQYDLLEQYIIAVYGEPEKENLVNWLDKNGFNEY